MRPHRSAPSSPWSVLLAALLLTIGAFPGSPGLARAGAPSTAPVLRIEAGMHTAAIRRVAIDPAGRFVVTGAYDKTARLWDARTGALLRTLRLPIGADSEGRVFAVALSPDSSLVAVAGWTGWEWEQKGSIYLFDRATGKLVRRIAGISNVVNRLAFSRDGAHLAATLWRDGLRVFAIATGQETARDDAYGNAAYGLDFDAAGRIVTACDDGQLRAYDSSHRLLARVAAPGGRLPHSVRFSPDGGRIAVGYLDTPRVDVLSAPRVDVPSGGGLEPLYLPVLAGVAGGNLASVAWSADGSTLCAAGTWTDSSGYNPVRCWADGGRGRFRDQPVATDTVLDLVPTPGGGMAFAAGDPAWGVLGSRGGLEVRVGPATADFRDAERAFQVDATGQRVRFGFQLGGRAPALFSLADRTLSLEPDGQPTPWGVPGATGLQGPRLEAPGLAIAGWQNGRRPTLNGAPLELSENESARALAIAPDGQWFALAGDYAVRVFDRAGKVRWQVQTPASSWAVNLSGDGRLVVAAFGDGTVRWYRAADGQLLLTLFAHADRRRWVAWTPSGDYDASPGGEALIGWHVNRGPDQEADFFGAGDLRDRFYGPEVVARVLTAQAEAAAVATADETRGPTARGDLFTSMLPPVVTLVEPREETRVSSDSLTVRVAVRSPSGEPVTRVWALIDGRRVEGARGLVAVASSPADGGASPSAGAPSGTSPSGGSASTAEGQRYTLTVPLPPRDCTLSVMAETARATGEPVSIHLRRDVARVNPAGGAATGADAAVAATADPAGPDLRSSLYLLAVGVGAYPNPKWRLDYARADAEALAAAFQAQSGKLYRKVESRVLTDEKATRDDILDGLEWLQRQTTARDVAVLFFAGHGVNESSTGRYHFLPYNADFNAFKRTMLPDSDVRSTLAAIPGKVLLFLDSCHSGNLMAERGRSMSDINRVINELASTANGVVVFSAATADQQSLEAADWGHGAFTKAVVEGLSGLADEKKTRRVTVNMLDLYVSERVKALTGGRQTPTTMKPPSVPDFPIAASP